VEILDAEPARASRSAPWLARMVGAGAAIALTIAVLPTLLGSLQPGDDASSPSAELSNSGQAAESVPALPPDARTAARIVLAADRLDVLDIDGGRTVTLQLPPTYRSSRSGAVLRSTDTTALLAAPPRTNAYEFSMKALAVADDGQTTDLGTASQLLRATEDAVWLTQRQNGRPTVRLVGLDGLDRIPTRLLPAQARVVAATPTTVLLGAAFGEAPTRLLDWDPGTGLVEAVVSESGVIHDANDRHVLWQECDGCPLQSYDRQTQVSRRLTPLPDGWQFGGRVHLSPDGRHWSVAAATSTAPDRRSIMIGHLPTTADADTITTVVTVPAIGRSSGPRMSWSPSGWLFVSTGYDLWAVSPDPHEAFTLDVDEHHGIAAG
jgi:hypothetical protein